MSLPLQFIVACAKDGGIGFQGDMLFHLPKDLRFFKETTMNGILVMGRRTFESLPGILPGRLHFVMTQQKNYISHPMVQTFDSYQKLFAALAMRKEPSFLAGGGKVYHDLLPYCSRGYRTVVESTAPTDTYFPLLEEMPQWQYERTLEAGIDGEYSYRIEAWLNQSPTPWIK